MFEAAIRKGGRTAMLYTFPPAREGMEAEFREEAARIDPAAVIESVLVEGAIDAVRAGDAETHNRLVAEAAARLGGFDSIALAHFSTARAVPAVRAVTDIPVLSSPGAAIDKLKRLLGAA
jgi:aspartate/glutamate racemase